MTRLKKNIPANINNAQLYIIILLSLIKERADVLRSNRKKIILPINVTIEIVATGMNTTLLFWGIIISISVVFQ